MFQRNIAIIDNDDTNSDDINELGVCGKRQLGQSHTHS